MGVIGAGLAFVSFAGVQAANDDKPFTSTSSTAVAVAPPAASPAVIAAAPAKSSLQATKDAATTPSTPEDKSVASVSAPSEVVAPAASSATDASAAVPVAAAQAAPAAVATPTTTTPQADSQTAASQPAVPAGGMGSGPAASEAAAATVPVAATPVRVDPAVSTQITTDQTDASPLAAEATGSVLGAAIDVVAQAATAKSPIAAVSGAAAAASSLIRPENGAVSKALYAKLYPSPSNTGGWAVVGLGLIAIGALTMTIPIYKPAHRRRRKAQLAPVLSVPAID